ncbi:hypothetical protein AMATHDRAFT_143498 [Amanita thiersii Skay4041]|uniref:RING-type E3 ubiquitin transferase n=1 Tax=Amanita thiersii Skay4041 TaxID=703135 RepID=A0A2A9NTK2_9AGAR|nr:hypothetical protein AMATHDRAFT_143498 [Amanita thiersii Skay4041]
MQEDEGLSGSLCVTTPDVNSLSLPDTCRICSTPGTEEQPLFHPCKCSGTIRYIHQDCLTTWLAHSKKQKCDLCSHRYSFTKVYAPNMPSSLPLPLLIRRLAQQFFYGLLFCLRAVVVATIWLAILPWLTLMAWRMYFSMGEATASWISNRPRLESDDGIPFYYIVPREKPGPLPTSFAGWFTTHPLWLDLPADIFTGQIIASLIVLTFVAVFLLREWISQNARPGVFEDDDLPVVADQPIAPARPAPQPVPQVVPPAREELHQGGTMDAPQQQVQENMVGAQDARIREQGHRVGEVRRRRVALESRTREKGKSRQSDAPSETGSRTKKRVTKSPAEAETVSRRVHEARMYRRRSPRTMKFVDAGESAVQDSQGLLASSDFQFTFGPVRLHDQNTLTFGENSGSTSESRKAKITSPQIHGSSNQPMYPMPSSAVAEGSKLTPSFLDLESTFVPGSSGDIPEDDVSPSPSPQFDTLGSPAHLDSTSTGSRSRSPTGFSQIDVDQTRPDSEGVQAQAGPSRLIGFSNGGEGDEVQPRSDNDEIVDGVIDGDETGQEVDNDETSDIPLEAEIREEHERYFPGESDGGRHGFNIIQGEEGNTIPVVPQNEHDDDEEEEDDDEAQDADDEEEEVEDVGINGDRDVIVQNGLGGAVIDIAQPAPVEAAGGGVDVNDELEGNMEDDMEGAMEAIGMRGPIYGVFQNAALMIFILDTAIGLGIWIPFTIGKSAALLSLDPHRTIQLMHLPIRAIRIITDPVVDSAVYLIAEFFLPPVIRTLGRLLHFIFLVGLFVIRLFLGDDAQIRAENAGAQTYNRGQEFLNNPWQRVVTIAYRMIEKNATESTSATTSSFMIPSSLSNVVLRAEPYFAVLGSEVRLTLEKFKETWLRLALGHGPVERLFAVSLGYIIFAVLVALYLNLLTVGNAKTAGRAVRNAIRQQLLVLKVAAFIFVELVTFPFGCGIVLDLTTIWLFPEANLASRVAFFVQAPLTAIFYHWIAGTLFMYAFAVLLSGCRSVMRPGAMWFIKDPQDQNSHPIRDILDRPALTQLRKIGVSGIMYSAMVVCVVGSVAGLLILGDKSIMPFRWKNREPLSNVPVDLLFLHLVLPYTMRYFRPKKVIKKFATVIWKLLATKLRLSSYFFGVRHQSEESSPSTWRAVFTQSPDDSHGAEHAFDGSFRRVPATDQLALPRDMRATAAVTEDGEPVDDEAQELIRVQNAEAEKAQRDVKADYMVVYIPPHFRYRIFCFIGLMWCICAVLLGISVALPIQLGRSFFKLFTGREVHDGYSLIAGFYLLWMCYIISKAIDRLDKRRQRRGSEGPRADLRIFVVKRGLLWFAKTTYMILFLGIVVPMLLALVVDFYIILPMRLTLKPNMVPRIRIVDAWALGLLYSKIVIHVHRIHPPNQISRGLKRIMDNGWTHPDPVAATKEVIIPLVAGLISMIFLPGIIFKIAQLLLPQVNLGGKFIFMHVYPGIFVFAGLIRSAVVLYDALSSWSQSIRDKEFLVEMRLLNHEAEKVESNKHTLDTTSVGPFFELQ